MTLPKHPLAGVYAVFLKGTPYVYVGEASDIPKRWRNHRDTWAWPNDVRYAVIREMPTATTAARRRTESALARLLKSRGYLTLSKTREEVLTSEWRAAVSRATAIKHNAIRGKEALREMGRLGAAVANVRRLARTTCKHGHPLTADNVWSGGRPNRRVCKTCNKLRMRQRSANAKALKHG